MILLAIDTTGGANFEGHNLRNVASAHIGGAALADVGVALQVTGIARGSGANLEGFLLNAADINRNTLSDARLSANVVLKDAVSNSLTGILTVGTNVVSDALPGDIVSVNNRGLRGAIAGGGATLPLIKLNADNRTEIGHSSYTNLLQGITLIGNTVTPGAAVGDISIGPNARYRASNAATTSSLAMLGNDGADRTTLFCNSKALRLQGTIFSTAALGVYQGKVMINIDGTDRYFPCYG